MRFALAVAIFALSCLPAWGADPRYAIRARALERLAKSEQARKFHALRSAQELGKRPGFSVDMYRFDLRILPAQAELAGVAQLELVALEEAAEIALDAAGLEIERVWFTDAAGARSGADFTVHAGTLLVRLPTAVHAGARFALTIAYSVTGDRREADSVSPAKGIFFVNGDGKREGVNPAVYTSSEPELARSWFPCLDRPDAKARASLMRVTAPAGWLAVSNGALKSVTTAPSGEAVYEWEERFPIPAYLISIAAAPYKVIQDRWRDIPVQYYVPASLEQQARVDFARTPAMIEAFSRMWTPYPFEKYAMAAAPLFTGAMEHTTATTISESHLSGRAESEDTVAHELAHHWWGDTVTAATWDDLWLNEGFATYAESLFEREFHGEAAALERLWWDAEAYFEFDPKGERAVVSPETAAEDKFSPAVYEKGAWVLHMLRNRVGDGAFEAASRAFLAKFAFGNATTDDLRRTFEEVAGQDLAEFFRQWVYGRGYPRLTVRWAFSSGAREMRVSVKQEQNNPFRFPLEIEVAGRSGSGRLGSFRAILEVSKAEEIFSVPLSGGVDEPLGIHVDPGRKVLQRSSVQARAGAHRE